jgi:hypothetical protein
MSNITVSASRNLDDAVATALAGTISASTASTTVTGVGTAFNTTNTPLGAPLYSGTTFLGIINSITNTTTLLLRANSAATVSGVTGTVYRGLALENGDTITIDTGATLTINSDSRQSQQNAVLGITTISEGNLVVDGTQVWWVPFDASSGNVPDLGIQGTNDVTVGGTAVGEFLGVYTAIGSFPSVAGTAMPTTGYVKLRRKVATINDNDVLTFTANSATVTVNSTTGGQRGWLQIVGRETSTGATVSGYSTTTWTGDWFELGTLTGAIGEQLQHYVQDYCPAVQVETGSGTGVYEWWVSIPSLTRLTQTFTTTAGSDVITFSADINSSTIFRGNPIFGNEETFVGFIDRIPHSITNHSVTNGSPTVTSSAPTTSRFTENLYVGQQIFLQPSGGTKTGPYTIQSIASDSSLTLTSNYTGTNATNAIITSTTAKLTQNAFAALTTASIRTSSTAFIAIQSVGTDLRNKFFTSSLLGKLTFGGANVMQLPPAGARVRVPNIHISDAYIHTGTLTSSTSSATVTGVGTNFDANPTSTRIGSKLWAGNVFIGIISSIASATSLTLTTNAVNAVSGAGQISSDVISQFPQQAYVITNSLNAQTTISGMIGQMRINGSGAKFDVRRCAFTDSFGRAGSGSTANGTNELYVEDCALSRCTSGASYSGGFAAYNCAKVTFKNCFATFLNQVFPLDINNCADTTVEGGFYTRPETNTWSGQIQSCDKVYVKDTRFGNVGANFYNWRLSGCTEAYIKDWSYVGRLSTHSYAGNVSSVSVGIFDNQSVVWDGFTYVIDPPVSAQTGDNNADIRVRNWGTKTSPLSLGTSFSLSINRQNRRISLSNIYISGPTNNQVSFTGYQVFHHNSCANTTTSTGFPVFLSTAGYQRRLLTISSIGGVGGHFGETINNLTAPTQVTLLLACGSAKSTDYRSQIAFTEDVGAPFRRDGSGVRMPNLNDQITWTWTYWIKGLTAFANVAPTINGTNTGNFAITYDLDKGTGFSGTFKTLNAANLSAETGILATGVKVRVRAVTTTANAGNILNDIRFVGTTSITNINNNPYPDNEAIYTITGSLANTRAAIFRNSDGVLLYTNSSTAPIYMYPDWYADTDCTLRTRLPGYNSLESVFTLKELGGSFPVSQIDNNIPNTNPGTKSITITNHGASPVTWNSKQWSITITVTDGSSAATVAQWISWNQAQDSYSFDSTRHNMAYHDMVIAVGSNYETARGTVFGSAGAALKGVRVVDGSDNEIPGFSRMQADDGTYYSPAASYTLTVSNIINNSRILVRRTDTSAVIANQVVTTGSFTYTYTHTTDIPIEIVVRKGTTSPYYQEWKTTTTLSNSNNTQTANQISDE